MLEIERKFLVKLDKWDAPDDFIEITQGYLTKNDKGSVRVRIECKKLESPIGYIMSKIRIDEMSNQETVDEISVENANTLINTFATKIIRKTRYLKIVEGFLWEIDYFHEPNNALLLAEIELSSKNQNFKLPEWIDHEVTGQPQYYNANM